MTRVGVIDTSTFINLSHISRHDLLQKLKYYTATTVYVEGEIDERGSNEVKSRYKSLKSRNLIEHLELSIEDLVEMARVPDGNRISNAELSCFVKARGVHRGIALCDDHRAKNFAQRYIDLPEIHGIERLLIDAYCEYLIGDGDIDDYQSQLSKKKCKFKDDLRVKAPEERAKRLLSV